jgi:hypothetical protein
MMSHQEAVSKAVGAIGLNTLALITSFQEQVEWWLRIASLVVAVVYTSVLTIRALTRKHNPPPNDQC